MTGLGPIFFIGIKNILMAQQRLLTLSENSVDHMDGKHDCEHKSPKDRVVMCNKLNILGVSTHGYK